MGDLNSMTLEKRENTRSPRDKYYMCSISKFVRNLFVTNVPGHHERHLSAVQPSSNNTNYSVATVTQL